MSERNESATPVPFSSEEMVEIRAAFTKQSEGLTCPRCGGPLEVGRPIAGGGTVPPVHEIRCNACQRSVLAAARN